MAGNLQKGLFGRQPQDRQGHSEVPAAFQARYSFSRLFFSFYLLTMGSFIVITLVADFVISAAIKNSSDDYSRRFMTGTVELIEKELAQQPQKQWSKAIKTIAESFNYKIELQDRSRLILPMKQMQKLDQGDIAFDSEGDILYHSIANTSWVLVVGPLSSERNIKYQRNAPLELRVRLMAWTLIGLCFAIAIWIWLRPLWRDLEAMRQTARALGEGQLAARAPIAKSRPFQLMADTLNGMADRIQQLIATQNELTGAISHELRTPIARMRFALEILTETDIRAEKERMWTMMERDLDELEGLIDASLTYSRFGRESPEISPVPTELRPWIKEQIELVHVLGRNVQIRLKISSLPPQLTICLDRRTMPFAIKNLLRNALKYAKSNIVVVIDVNANSRLVRIHVDDDGIGVPVEERERIFHAFTRLDRSRDRSTGGYGLGLAITRQVMELHGGSAYVEESPLGGARFTLEWPANCELDNPNVKRS